MAGKQEGIDGARSGLWSEFHRIIGELRPRFVVIENVANLVSLGLERVLCDLAEIGYDAEWQIISANDVGAHHLRKRIWIIAYPNSNGIGSHRQGIDTTQTQLNAQCRVEGFCGDVADSNSERSQGYRGQYKERNRVSKRPVGKGSNTIQKTWLPEPNLGDLVDGLPSGLADKIKFRDGERNQPIPRVFKGISQRASRLKGLGNAVVPQIPEIIGNRLVEIMES